MNIFKRKKKIRQKTTTWLMIQMDTGLDVPRLKALGDTLVMILICEDCGRSEVGYKGDPAPEYLGCGHKWGS